MHYEVHDKIKENFKPFACYDAIYANFSRKKLTLFTLKTRFPFQELHSN